MNQNIKNTMKKIYLLLTIFLLSTTIHAQWTQLGNDIDGESAHDWAASVSLSSDGYTVAVGSPNNDNNGESAGQVKIYKYSSGAWNQQGLSFHGQKFYDNLGRAIALNASGNIIAIGSPNHSINNDSLYSVGQIRVFEIDSNSTFTGPVDITFNMRDSWGDGWEGTTVDIVVNSITVISGATLSAGNFNSLTFSVNCGDIVTLANWNAGWNTGEVSWTISDGYQLIGSGNFGDPLNCTPTCVPLGWTQIGQDINGVINFNRIGSAVGISSDGYTLATVTSCAGGSAPLNGVIYVYNGSSWNQKGQTIMDVCSGASISANGDVVAFVEYPYFSENVKIFEWGGSAWVQRGLDIIGEQPDDGASIALSADGNTIAIGAPYNNNVGTNNGHVRIYTWNGSSWILKGAEIDGILWAQNAGWSVSLSADGNIVAFGSPGEGVACPAGATFIYQWNGSNWVQKGLRIEGEHTHDWSGYSVSLNSDGNIVAIGALNNDNINGINAGHSRVYQFNGVNSVLKNNISNTFMIHPNPSDGVINIQTENTFVSSIQIYNTIGELVFFEDDFNTNNAIQLYQAPGLYMLVIKANNSTSTSKLILK